jgi:hypothetical protein
LAIAAKRKERKMKRWLGLIGRLVSGLTLIALLQGCMAHTQVRSGYSTHYPTHPVAYTSGYPRVYSRPPVYVYSPPPKVVYYNVPAYSNPRDAQHRDHGKPSHDRKESHSSSQKRDPRLEKNRDQNREPSRDNRQADRRPAEHQRANVPPAQTRPVMGVQREPLATTENRETHTKPPRDASRDSSRDNPRDQSKER